MSTDSSPSGPGTDPDGSGPAVASPESATPEVASPEASPPLQPSGGDAHPDARPRRLVGIMVGAGGLVLALLGIRAANGILGPALLGMVVVVTVSPLTRSLRARGWPAWAAMLATMALSFGVVLVLFVGSAVALLDFIRLVPTYSAEFAHLQATIADWLAQIGVSNEDIRNAFATLSPADLASAAWAALGSLGGFLGALIMLLTVTFFLCIDSTGFPARMALVERAQPRIAESFAEFAHGTRLYLLVATVFGALVALVDVVILALLGIPDPWVWGILAFLTGYIPNVGFVIGLIPVSVLALLEGGARHMLLVIVAYCVVNFVLQSLIQPKFVGDTVGLATTVTFLSLALWTLVIGPLGAILAVPLTLFARAVLVSADPSLRWVGDLIASSSKAQAELAALSPAEPPVPVPEAEPA